MLDQLDADTQRVGKTEVAMAPTKVQCRIGRPHTSAHHGWNNDRGRIRSPSCNRRPNATDAKPTVTKPESESSPAPAAQSMEPVPLVPANAGASPSLAHHTASPDPRAASSRSGAMSGAMVEGVMVEEVQELAQSTPSLLDNARTTPREPQLLSPPEQPGMK